MLRPSMRLFATLLLLLMVLFANEMKPSEARTCKSASQKFRGICVSNRNCASVCSTEGFPDGECEGLRRRCFCTRNC